MSNFFEPKDIVAKTGVISNVTRGGSAFAVSKEGDQIFISPKIVNMIEVEIGDTVTMLCVDNYHLNANTDARFAVQWRAIRAVVDKRLSDTVEPVAAPEPVSYGEAPKDDVDALCAPFLTMERAWTARQLSEKTGIEQLKVSNFLKRKHDASEISAVKVYARGDMDRASSVYYARDVDVFYDLIDEVELE